MRCDAIEALLAPYLDDELVEGDRLAVETHLAGCAECTARTERARHFLTAVRAAAHASTAPAPQALRARVSAGLRQARGRERRAQALKLSALAASVAVCALVGHHEYRVFQRRLFVDDVASRHARQFPLEIQRPSPEQLEAWFGGKLDHRVLVPRFPNAVAEGARLLNVREKQAAYIRYQAPRVGAHVGLFVYGDEAFDDDVGPLPSAEHASSHGYNVVGWRDGDVVYRLVTDLDERDLAELLPPEGAKAGDDGHHLPTLQVAPAGLR